MTMTLDLKQAFPPRKASIGLRDQLVNFLSTGSSPAGARFFSDATLVKMSGLSRQTVRRALDDLHRGGWIVRHPGKGSFVGPRVAMRAPAQRPQSAGHEETITPATAAKPERKVIRLAVVLMYGMGTGIPDWYSQQVLAGLDDATIEQGVSIELVGCEPDDYRSLGLRLVQGQPDVLAVMAASFRHATAVFEARRLGIPSILAGTRLLELGLPTVHEDGVQGSAAAVRHLAEVGHRRIGFVQRDDVAPFAYQRREGYLQGLAAVGMEPDERLAVMLSVDKTDEGLARNAKRFADYFDRYRPTALVLGSAAIAQTVGQFVRSRNLQIPRDLSIVSFDQAHSDYQASLGLRPTIVQLPLREIGWRMATMARDVAEGRQVSQRTELPCQIVDGESVAAPPATCFADGESAGEAQ